MMHYRFLVFFTLLFCGIKISFAQSAGHLYQSLDVNIRNQKLSEALEGLAKQGGFYFSYNSNLIAADSLVSVSTRASVREILDILFKGNFEYKETPNHIILRPAPYRLSIIPDEIPEADKVYTISGYVIDDRTGQKLNNASIYEKRMLISTLTDADGFFKLKVRSPESAVVLTVSKEFYRDTTITLLSTVNVSGNKKKNRNYLYDPEADEGAVERTAFGRLLISSQQKIQSLNISGFFANTPFQASITPGLSSHGSLSGQVVNKFSLNVLGGYTAGVDGLEMAGIFNINKRSVQYVQVAGIFNMVGANAQGVQLAGINNTVLDSIQAIQAAGIYNMVKGDVKGVQLAGIFNAAFKGVNGIQIAGISNLSRRNLYGLQIAGIGNNSFAQMNGIQVAGIYNYARKLNGVQIGLINVADTSSGVSIGLINIVRRNGYHQLAFSTNEAINGNLEIKTGNAALYSIISGGFNWSDTAKVYAVGLGLGHDMLFTNWLSLAAELSTQTVYLGSFEQLNFLYRAKANVNITVFKGFRIFGGPAFNVYKHEQTIAELGFKTSLVPQNTRTVNYNRNLTGWAGWQVGLSLF